MSGIQATESWELTPMQKQMCALSAAGLSNIEIAEATNRTKESVYILLKHPAAREYIATLSTNLVMNITTDVSQQIRAATAEAFQKNLTLMRTAKKEEVQQRSCFDILDRGGFKPKEYHVVQDMVMNKEETELIHETLNQLGKEIPFRPPVENAIEVLKLHKEESK